MNIVRSTKMLQQVGKSIGAVAGGAVMAEVTYMGSQMLLEDIGKAFTFGKEFIDPTIYKVKPRRLGKSITVRKSRIPGDETLIRVVTQKPPINSKAIRVKKAMIRK